MLLFTKESGINFQQNRRHTSSTMKRKIIAINFALMAILPIVGICNITKAAEPMEIVKPIPIESEAFTPKPSKIIEEVKVEEIPVEVSVEIPVKEYRYISECPLGAEIQEGIFDICEEYGISFEFVMAMIMQESSFRPEALGDGGKSKGLMQIQERWHKATMDEVGVTDLYDPIGNVEVGVAILQGYFEEHEDVYHVLMKYNGGASYANRMMNAGKVSDYAKEITERTVEYERSNGI